MKTIIYTIENTQVAQIIQTDLNKNILKIKNKGKQIMKALTFLIILIVFDLISLMNLDAQVTQEWVAIYNGPGNDLDAARSIAIDCSGNVYVTGRSDSETGADYATIKYNSSGVQQWIQRYNGPVNSGDIAYSLAVDDSENVYVTGSSIGMESPIGTGWDYATVKYNSSGVQQWVQRYNGPANDLDGARSIAVDGSGNVYVTGFSLENGTDYATIKYNSSGVQQWVQRYDGLGDGASSLAIDDSGNVYVTGSSGEFYPNTDYATIKYNSLGVQQWVQRYNGPGNQGDGAKSLAVDDSGNVYVTGFSYGSGTGTDYATIKYNLSGVQQWVQRYNGLENQGDGANSLAIDDSGNVYVTGTSGEFPYTDYATIKYNSSGTEQWVQRFDGSAANSFDESRGIAVDGSGNVYVTGRSEDSVTGADYATIKYNASGVQQWIQRYNGLGNSSEVAYSLVVDSSGNVYVTGFSLVSGTGYDYATIKYSQTVGIPPIPNEIPKEYMLSQNYPNPFNPVTKIKFDIPSNVKRQTSDVRLVVYDAIGRDVTTLVNERLSPGSYEVEFNGSNFTSGIYFYKLNAGTFSEVRRMILLK